MKNLLLKYFFQLYFCLSSMIFFLIKRDETEISMQN